MGVYKGHIDKMPGVVQIKLVLNKENCTFIISIILPVE